MAAHGAITALLVAVQGDIVRDPGYTVEQGAHWQVAHSENVEPAVHAGVMQASVVYTVFESCEHVVLRALAESGDDIEPLHVELDA